MKVVRARFNKKSWVVNSKGKRLTPKYTSITEHNYGPFYLADCRDDFWEIDNPKPARIYVFNEKTEKEADIDFVTSHQIVCENVFALKSDEKWHFYDTQGNLLRNDVTYFHKCANYPYIIATIDKKAYFLDENMEIITDPFVSVTDFDEFGRSVVRVDEKNQRYAILSVQDGMFLMEPWSVECDLLRPLSKDFFRIQRNYCDGVIDTDGKEILPTIYQEIRTCGANHFLLKYNEKYGLADVTGKTIFECFYDYIMETPDKFAVKDFARLETSKTLEVPK